MKRLAWFGCFAVILGGCSWLNGLTMRSQSPDEPDVEVEESIPRLVGDLAVPTGMHSVRIETVAMVTGLHGTGSDPSPSPQRSALLDEMQVQGVINPNAVLRSGDVSLVLLQGILRPGIQKGDRFDVEVRVPSQSETTSLRGGYLLEVGLTETAVLGNQVHRGKRLALAKGPVMIDPMADPKKDHILSCRGRVLGGGACLKSRTLGLVLTPGHQSVMNSSRVANAVNKRFNTFESGIKTGVAKAKTDELIELAVHPRYKDNIERYMQVVRALPISETAPERMQRIAELQSQLFEPSTAASAAIQLEAIGSQGVDTLLKGIASKDPEVRFYAAEALAYLDRREAAEPLGQIARDQPAFRVFALTALSAMQEYAAYEQLKELLASPSAETRYGAFRALWAGNQADSLVKGESLGGQFQYHVLDVAGPPMIHVTRSRIPEIVIFGTGQQIQTPLAVNAGNEIMVTSSGGNEICVSKFSVKDGDQKRTVSTSVDDVIRAIIELGGTYPDVVQALQEAKSSGALVARFEVDALPVAGRSYERMVENDPNNEQEKAESIESGKADGEQKKVAPARPTPDLFAKRGDSASSLGGNSDEKAKENPEPDDDSDENAKTKKGFFARMLGRE
jgi:flagellar basal body P-ring protein FlgI